VGKVKENICRLAQKMMKAGEGIILLVIYTLSCIPAQSAWVVCVRADGTARYTAANHGCAEYTIAEEHEATTSHNANGHDGRSSLAQKPCCEDYPAGTSIEQLVPQDSEKAAAAPGPLLVATDLAAEAGSGSSVEPTEPVQKSLPHLETVILLI
jgi:hypothetical protein